MVGDTRYRRRDGENTTMPFMLLLVAFAASIPACGDDDSGRESAATDVAAFCADAPDQSVEVPESYVGSEDHVEDLRKLRADAPAEIRDDLDLTIEHFDDAVDPSDPDSQLTENFPKGVNAAIRRIRTYIDESCVE